MLWQRTYGFPSPLFWGTVSVLLALLVRWWHRKRKSTSSVPRKWRCVGELSELTVFPIKSCAGIILQEAECTEYGIQTVSDGPLKLRDRFVPKSQINNYVNLSLSKGQAALCICGPLEEKVLIWVFYDAVLTTKFM
jgi:hypothetical protein